MANGKGDRGPSASEAMKALGMKQSPKVTKEIEEINRNLAKPAPYGGIGRDNGKNLGKYLYPKNGKKK